MVEVGDRVLVESEKLLARDGDRLGCARLLALVFARVAVAFASFVGAVFAALVGVPLPVVGVVGCLVALACGGTVAGR